MSVYFPGDEGYEEADRLAKAFSPQQESSYEGAAVTEPKPSEEPPGPSPTPTRNGQYPMPEDNCLRGLEDWTEERARALESALSRSQSGETPRDKGK